MSAHNSHHGEHAHGGPAVYTANLIGLLILTGITVGASRFDFGAANVAIALSIATVKAILVALFFMHLKWDKPTNAIIAISGFLFLGIFLMFDLIDLNNRKDAIPRLIKPMEQPTQVPESMNPLLTPAPKPYVAAPAPAGGEAEHEAH